VEVRRSPAERRPRTATGQLDQEVVAVLSRLPAEFTQDDVLRALGRSPHRVAPGARNLPPCELRNLKAAFDETVIL
jgi:hypothetical protein